MGQTSGSRAVSHSVVGGLRLNTLVFRPYCDEESKSWICLLCLPRASAKPFDRRLRFRQLCQLAASVSTGRVNNLSAGFVGTMRGTDWIRGPATGPATVSRIGAQSSQERRGAPKCVSVIVRQSATRDGRS